MMQDIIADLRASGMYRQAEGRKSAGSMMVNLLSATHFREAVFSKA